MWFCCIFSNIVRPRCPWRKDPDLDYDVDSDEEWEEVQPLLFRLKFKCSVYPLLLPRNDILVSQEEPGESLSDCDKDEEEESCEGCTKGDDEDESEDGFLVPDGYLSENEVKTNLKLFYLVTNF